MLCDICAMLINDIVELSEYFNTQEYLAELFNDFGAHYAAIRAAE